jgi:hypothetical protein
VARGQPVFVAGEDEADVLGTIRGHLDFLSRFSASDGHVVIITHPGFWFGAGRHRRSFARSSKRGEVKRHEIQPCEALPTL